ncbi:MAG: ABC transporter permease [Candidatus Cohnella colombiensis]|uniref:ABC transporter permease n=1 Tax=Candidatus Cohnella colombiensis TaxID=3121368 RepID=A0AA95EX85_9BACL|nr:MAG: ABC transporter permease [Cohnella sp.]
MSNRKQLFKLFGANLKMMFREKQVWFWNIFFPIILMVIFMVIFGSSDSSHFKAKIAVVEMQENATSNLLEDQLRHLPVFEWKSEQPVTMEQADDWIKNKKVDAVIVLPASEETKSLELIYNKENEKNATSQAISGIIGQFLEQVNWSVAGITPTFNLTIDSVSGGSEDLTYVDFLLTGMIALAVAQGGLFGMVDMVEMRRKGLLKRLRMTPAKMGLLGTGSLLVRFILGIVQVLILSAIGVLGFGAKLHIDAPTLIVAFLVGALTFNAIGYMISSFSKSIEAYMGIANIASFLMMFLSGIFFPTSGFPEWLLPVSKVLPLTYFVNGMRDGMVYGSGMFTAEFWTGIGILAIWGVISFALAIIIYRKMKIEVR